MAFFKQPSTGAAQPGRYGALLLVLIASYLLSAFITARWMEALQVVLFTVAMLLAVMMKSHVLVLRQQNR